MSNLQTEHKNSCSQMELLLRQNALFTRLNNEQLISICSHSKTLELSEGEVLFNHGDTVHNFYFVYSGLIKLYRLSPDGQEKIFEMEATGRIFAEALMFMQQTDYPVSAAAMQKTTVVAISTTHFLKVLKKSVDTCLLIMGDLSKRMHELINEIDKLSSLSGRNRVATYMLEQSMQKGPEFKLDIPKNAIASMLSLQPETFSRLLKELCRQQVIQVKERKIRILDKSLLRSFAGIIN